MTKAENDITNLYLVRHGETDHNLNHIVQGRGVNVPLNETGIFQAKALASLMKSVPLDAIYSSTLLRAAQTARVIVEQSNIDAISFISDLEEMSWGLYEGRSASIELKEAFSEMKNAWKNGIYSYEIPEGETLLQVQKRGLKALDYIIKKHVGQNVLVVAHGRFNQIVLASILQEFGLERMEDLKQNNCALNHVVISGKKIWAEKLNSVDHLENQISL